MKKILLIALLSIFTENLTAQMLLPFLDKNGLYGFADETGKLVISPQFEGDVKPFYHKTLAVDVRQNDAPVRVFRNGKVLPNPRLLMHRPMPVLSFDANEIRLDSFGHLVAFQVESRWQILDLRKGGKQAETYMEDFLNLPQWAKMHTPSLTNGADFRFRFGMLKIHRSDGRVNFIDNNLRELLPHDVATGSIADAQHLIFAEGEGRFGVADITGKTVVPPVFYSLEPGGKPGIFLANKQHNGATNQKWKCGVVTARGNIVIDTIYSDIEKVDGADLFIVRQLNKTGLFDLNGHEIIPIEAEYGYKQGSGFSIFKWPNGNGMNIIGDRGQTLLDKNVAEVTALRYPKALFFKVKSGGWTSILDTSMAVLMRDSVENLDLIEINPLLFMVRKNSKTSALVSIRDIKGNTVAGEKFDHIWSPSGWPDGIRFTYLNKLKGLSDKNFNEILPPVFEDITLEATRTDTLIWAKKKGGMLFVAFDKKGRKRTDVGAAPNPRRESAYQTVASFQELSGGGQMATLFDGTQIKWPDSLKNKRVLSSFLEKASGAIVLGLSAKQITSVLDHRFKNLLPDGFTVPEKSASELVLDRFTQFGLLVVQQLPRQSSAPKPVPQPTQNQRDNINDGAMVEAPVLESTRQKNADQTEKVLPGAACGVIDWLGNWILAPKAGVEYLVLSPFLVAEFPGGARSSSHEFFPAGLRLHRVRQPDSGVVVANWLGQDRFSTAPGSNMKIGRIRAGTQKMAEYAYFDHKGNPLTDWIFENGPDFLGLKNLVHIWEKGALSVQQAVIDKKGQTIFTLGSWATKDSPRYRGGDQATWNYLTVYKKRDSIVKDSLGRLAPEPEGLMDTTGHVVVPPEYFNLAIFEDYQLLTAQTAAGNYVLLSIEGKKIHTFQSAPSGIAIQKIGRTEDGKSTGLMVAYSSKETLLLDKTGAVVQQYNWPFSRETLPEIMAQRYLILLKNNHTVWVDFRSGQRFFE